MLQLPQYILQTPLVSTKKILNQFGLTPVGLTPIYLAPVGLMQFGFEIFLWDTLRTHCIRDFISSTEILYRVNLTNDFFCEFLSESSHEIISRILSFRDPIFGKDNL